MRYDFQARVPSRAGANLTHDKVPITATIAGTGTTVINLGGSPNRTYVTAATFSDLTNIVGGGTVTAILRKRTGVSTYTTLTSTLDLTTLTVEQPSAFTFLTTAAVEQARIVGATETLQLVITTTGAVTTQPTGMVVTVEGAVLQ